MGRKPTTRPVRVVFHVTEEDAEFLGKFAKSLHLKGINQLSQVLVERIAESGFSIVGAVGLITQIQNISKSNGHDYSAMPIKKALQQRYRPAPLIPRDLTNLPPANKVTETYTKEKNELVKS